MTNKELADRLNEQFGFSGRAGVTANVIRQWVNWQLLPKSKITNGKMGNGPLWHRDNAALDLAAKLTQFRGYGLVSEMQLVARCYIEGWPIEIETARRAMMSRAEYSRKHMSKRLSVDYGKLAASAELTPVNKRALEKQLGKQDSRFIGTPLEFKDDIGVRLNLAALSGNALPPDILGSLAQAMPTATVGDHFTKLMPLLAAGISGLAGLPDEIDNSLLDSIENCSDAVFAHSAKCTKSLFFDVNDPELLSQAEMAVGDTAKYIFDQIRQLEPTEWPTLMFLALCHSQHNSGMQLSF